MVILELEKLLTDLESDRAERKASISDKEKICQVICAFANNLPNHQQPSVIFIGVNDDGSCANLPVTDELLLTLSQMREQILPFPTMTVQKRNVGGCELVVVIVEPADAPPARYRGRVWVRVGPRLAVASREEERRLTEKRQAKDLPFDLRPVWAATLDDIDFETFRRVYLPAALPRDMLEENQRPLEQQLTAMRFATVEPESVPTVLGILVVGKDPRHFIPGAYIQFLRIDGTELTHPIKDNKEIDGTLNDMLERLDDVFRAHISIALDVTTQLKEIRLPDYPIVALRQLAHNAILHRTYEGTNAPVRITWFSDRIEIHSPGGTFGQVNRQNFGQAGITDYRNSHLAEAMKNLGHIQRFGLGIPLARQALKENGNPPPEFVVEDTNILVTIQGRRDGCDGL